MNIEIKNRFTNEIIVCGEYKSIKDCLEKNRNANLRGANLRGANLEDAKNIKLPIINLYGSKHSLFYIDNIIKIGCEKYTIKEWLDSYEEIGKKNDYTELEINEYYKYIKMIADMEGIK